MKLTGRKQAGLRIYVWLNALEGAVALIIFASVQSMARNARLLGLSYPRLAMLGADMLLLAVLIAFAIKVSREPDFRTLVLRIVDGYLANDGGHFRITSLSLSVAIFGGVTIWFLKSSIVAHTDLAYIVFLRVQPLVFWGIAVASQTFILLLALWPELWRKSGYLTNEGLVRAGSGLALVFLALGQWAIIYFRIDVFASIRHWYWPFFERRGFHIAYIIGVVIVSVVVGGVVFRKAKGTLARLVLIMALGYLVQVGFACAEGGGFDFLRQMYLGKGRPEYAQVVSNPHFSLGDVFAPHSLDDQQAYFLGTKPPGYLMVYGVFEELVNPGYRGHTYEFNLDKLTAWMSYVFPLVSMLTIPALYLLGTSFQDDLENRAVPGLYYVLMPGVILFSLQLDQVIFPAVSCLCLYLGLKAQEQSSPFLMVVAGLIGYCALFISFSMIPVLALILVFLGLDTLLLQTGTHRIVRLVKLAGALVSGFLLMHLLFLSRFGYDVVPMYRQAAQIHSLARGGIVSFSSWWDSLVLDYIEFFWWTTLPVLFLLVLQLLGTAQSVVRGKIRRLHIMVLAFLVTLLAVGAFGMTIGEVARLWLLLVPIVTLFVSAQMETMFKRGLARHGLIVSLLITAFLIFKYELPWL